jgi:hypothetical protein
MAMPSTEPRLATIDDLKFDRHNPRMPDETFASDEDVLRYLIEECDVQELVNSIMSSGWLDFEPLIVQKGSNVVFEGNRRLAALHLIRSESRRNALGYTLPNQPIPPLPEQVRVIFVADRRDARRYIAFKHINGPAKWDAYAKAKYASEWLEDSGESIELVSKMLGDNHNTVRRLVNGFNVLEQAEREGFDRADRSKRRFSFSHLYTAISRPAVREFIGLSDDAEEVLPKNPVPTDKSEDLERLMGWLYGQEKKRRPTVVQSQNPHLNWLVRVIAHPQARDTLIRSNNLDAAFELVESKSTRFKDALLEANRQCETTLGLSAHFDPKENGILLDVIRNMAATVRDLRKAMVEKTTGADEEL